MEADPVFEAAVAAFRAGRFGEAHALFGQSGAAGNLQGAVIHCNLTASRVSWDEGLRLLRRLAPYSPRCARELAVIEAMDPSPPPPGEVVSDAPHLMLFRGLFTRAECAYLAEAAAPMLVPSSVVDPVTGAQRPDPGRTSDDVGFTPPLENPAIHALNRRIATASGTAVEQGEPLQVLRYRAGGEYKPHFDAIPGFANQRILTMIVWLSSGFEGGETHFLKTGAMLKGGVGDALLFRNALPDGRRDPDSCHAGLPVRSGEKLIASRWIRAEAFVPPLDGRPG